MSTRSPRLAVSADPLSAGMIAAELHRESDEVTSTSGSTNPLAPRAGSVCTSLTLLWVHTAFTAVQLLALPRLLGQPFNALGFGPALCVVLCYAMFALHFWVGHAKARLPYAIFSGLMMTLGFAGLAESASILLAGATATGIVLSGGALYGVLGHAMDDWFASCRKLVGVPATGVRCDEHRRLTAVIQRASAAARTQMLVGLGWLACSAGALTLVVLTRVPDALAPASVALVPMAVAGIAVTLAGGWKALNAHKLATRLAQA